MSERILSNLTALGIVLAPALLKWAGVDDAEAASDPDAEVLCVSADGATAHEELDAARVEARLPPGAVVQVLEQRRTWTQVAYVSQARAELGWVASASLEACAPAADARPSAATDGPARSMPAVAAANATGLSIFAVDIGQGDATVVLGPLAQGRRRALVIDAGDRHPSGSQIVGDLLADQGVQSLDYVILSHFDSDHLGGFVTIQGSTSLLWNDAECDPSALFPTVAIFDQGLDTNETKSSAQWLKCVPLIASQRGIKHGQVQGGQEIGTVLDLGGGARATIVAGDGFVLNRTERVASVETPNERSIAVLISNAQGFDFLVTGDLIGQAAGAEDAKAEAALGAALREAGVDLEVLRTGHHGAANATEASFLGSIRAEVAVISTGDDQGANFRHPRCKTYEALRDAGVGLVLQTELGNTDCEGELPLDPVIVNGTIRIDVNGAHYGIRSHGTESANGQPTSDVAFTCSVTAGCSAGSAPPAGGAGTPCCKTCTTGKPCGNSCIAQGSACNAPPGCACAGL